MLTYGWLAALYWRTWLWPRTVPPQTVGVLFFIIITELWVIAVHLMVVPLFEGELPGWQRSLIYLGVAGAMSFVAGIAGWAVGSWWPYKAFWLLTAPRAVELLGEPAPEDMMIFAARALGSLMLYMPLFFLSPLAPQLGLAGFEPAPAIFVEKLGKTRWIIGTGSAYFSLMTLLEPAFVWLALKLPERTSAAPGTRR